MVPNDVDQRNFAAALINLTGRLNERFDNNDPRGLGRCFQVVAQLANTASDQHPHVGFLSVELRQADRVANVPGQHLIRKWNHQLDHSR